MLVPGFMQHRAANVVMGKSSHVVTDETVHELNSAWTHG